jgi:hypothetical protein
MQLVPLRRGGGGGARAAVPAGHDGEAEPRAARAGQPTGVRCALASVMRDVCWGTGVCMCVCLEGFK